MTMGVGELHKTACEGCRAGLVVRLRAFGLDYPSGSLNELTHHGDVHAWATDWVGHTKPLRKGYVERLIPEMAREGLGISQRL